MYKALIVDDEIYAVMGIKRGVQWQDLQIFEVYEAYNLREALRVFERTPIDIMICDIEMPKGTGIELLERVNEISPETETIFLTAHSAFDFMKRAIQLDGFDYLLKPVEFGMLQETIEKALQSIEQERELNKFREQYRPYYEMWRKKKSLITDKFWNDLLSGRTVCTPENVKSILEEHELIELQDAVFLPVIVSVESWLREFGTKDEEMMEYAIRKAASEMLLPTGKGEVIQTKQGANVVIIIGSDGDGEGFNDIHERCEKYIRGCREFFSCNLSCYIGKSSTLFEIAHTYGQLMEIEYHTLNKSNQVYTLASLGTPAIQTMIPRISTWTILMEQGKLAELQQEIRSRMAELVQLPGLSVVELEGFHHEFMQMVHYVLHKNGLSAFELFQIQEGIPLSSSPRNPEQLEAAVLQMVQTIYNRLHLHQNHSIIPKLQCYIMEHINEPITREQLASYVHLNPAYLSRLFKREVGESITDYILHTRMSRAKDLITSTTIPISDVAKAFGYHNFSHFSKMFRKVYHASPQQYRQQLGCK